MSLTAEQVDQLLKPIKPSRVLKDNDGLSHVSQQDIRAHLTRIFGFGGWSSEIVELTCVRDAMKTVPAKNGRPERQVPDVTYRCRLRLSIRDPHGDPVCSFEDVGTGTSPNLPSVGDAHDFAAKNAVSYALKRCATNLGDGFGLSLYNRGQVAPLVIDTLVRPGVSREPKQDVQSQVPDQVDLGDERPADEPEPQPQPAARRADRMGTGTWQRIVACARKLGWAQDELLAEYASTHNGVTLDSVNDTEGSKFADELEAMVAARGEAA